MSAVILHNGSISMNSGMKTNRLGFISANNYTDPYPVYPLGVSYLTTWLEKEMPQCEISVFDFNVDGTYDDLAAWCRQGEFDVIAVALRNIDDNNIYSDNCFVSHYRKMMETVRSSTDVKVVAGGPGFSIFPALLFKELGLDYGVRGEGEETLKRLLEALFEGRQCDDIEGLVWKDAEGNVKVNPRKTFVSAPQLRLNPQTAPFYFKKSGMLNVQTKRGCPFGCVYCSYPLIDGRKVRTLDISTVVENISEMYFKHGINYLFFTDSVFNIDREYNAELCRRIIESGAKISWGAYFSPCSLTKEDLALYQKAGLTHIEFGTDTLADRTLESYGKRFTWQDILQTSRWAGDLGIFYAHFMILGGLGETDATLDQTFERSKELGLTVFFPYIGMRIYPETKLFETAVREGVVADAASTVNPCFYVSKDITVETVKERALASGAKWVFPDEPSSPVIGKLRSRHVRGPLWEYLRY